jgi:hypothetical protein
MWGAASGEAQSIFLDTSLVESVTAHTEAISAEYGGFTGGVIDAKLKDARRDRWHFLAKYRYTKDDWAKFHLTDDQKNTDKSVSASYQPEFTKYEYTISADGPVSDHLGLMLSYGKQHSTIPLWSGYDINRTDGTTYKERDNQYRNNENYLIKLNTHNIDDFEASLTAIYAPYTHSTAYSDEKNNDQDIKGGGYNIAYDMKNVLSFGLWKNTLAYKQSEVSAETANYRYLWTNTSGYANWTNDMGNTVEGNGGSRDLTQNSFIYKSVLDFDEIKAGAFTHLVKTGIETEFGKARYKREAGYFFRDAELNASAAGSKDDGIIDGEQWAARVSRIKEQDNKQDYTTAALFLEDNIKFDRYAIRPGVRVSTDTITDNADIAPRLFANADVFNDKTFNVYGGYNRYYGGLKLYNAIYEYRFDEYKRTAYDQPWVYNRTVKMDYSLDGLKTPYSDEFSVGASLAKWDSAFKLDFVQRKYKDQIMQKENSFNAVGSSTDVGYVNTNDGESSYWGVTLTASKEYELGNTKHFSELSATNSEAASNMMGLNAFGDDSGYSTKYTTYNGKLKKFDDVPAANYNSPWVITYNHIMEVSDFLRFGLNARYEKGVHGFEYVDDNGLKDPDGLDTRNYVSKNYGDIFTVDLSANYDLKFGGNKLTFGVEVLNLLNRKNDASYTENANNIDGYAMGRQFYANVKYEY